MGTFLLTVVLTAAGIAVAVMIAGAVVIMAISEFIKTLLGRQESCC